MSLSRIGRPLVLGATAVALLSGCGSASPGTAVTVGSDSISVVEVDDAAEAACRSFSADLEQRGEVVSMGEVRQIAVQLLTMSSMADQVADEYGVRPGADYAREVAAFTAEADEFPEHLREPYLEIRTAQARATSVMLAAGREALAEEGVADAADEQAAQRGADIFDTWSAANDVEIDPRFGVRMVDGVLERADTGLSVPVSDTAVRAAANGTAEVPDAEYARSLPERQRCG